MNYTQDHLREFYSPVFQLDIITQRQKTFARIDKGEWNERHTQDNFEKYFIEFRQYLSKQKNRLVQHSALYQIFQTEQTGDVITVALMAEFCLFPLLFTQLIRDLQKQVNSNIDQQQKLNFALSFKQLPLPFTYKLSSMLYMTFSQVDIFQGYANDKETYNELLKKCDTARNMIQQLQADCLQALYKYINRPSTQVIFRYKLQQEDITEKSQIFYGFDLLKVLGSLNLQEDINDIIDFAVKETKLQCKQITREQIYNDMDKQIRQLIFTIKKFDQNSANEIMPMNQYNRFDFNKYKNYYIKASGQE